MSRPIRPVHTLRTVAVVLALGFVAACSSPGASGTPDHPATTAAATAATTSTVDSAATATTIPLTPAGGTYGVGRRDIELVDHSRGTDADAKANVAAKDDRTLPTVILYPTAETADDATDDDHPVAEGRFPLVVFSHGVTASGPAYVGILKKLAAAGYVVALPTFPLTSGPGGWNNIGQTTNQPADVSFIIGRLLDRSAKGDALLGGHLDPDAVAVAGHSLGAITSLLFYNSCCRDDRVRAVVAVSGITFPGKSKTDDYDDAPTDVPLLMLHGEKDKVLSYDDGSRLVFDKTLTTVPRGLVTFPDRGHTDILGAPSFMPAVVAFLDRALRDDPEEWKSLGKELASNGDATVEVAGGLPEPKD